MLPGYPRVGAVVRFCPPDGVFQEPCAQQRAIGRVGVIYVVYNDSYVHVLFDGGLVLLNTAYLEETHGIERARGVVRSSGVTANRKGKTPRRKK